MKVIAEGIETENQLALLRNLGCDYGQGYLMSRPLPKDEIETLLYQKHLWFPKGFLADEKETSVPNEISGQTISDFRFQIPN
jgi:predicted signal transduction protein with EAL and GGDEF domain